MALVVENLPANAGDRSSIPGLRGFPGGGHGNPFQYSCLENPMDRGAWWAPVHRLQRIGHDWSELACSTHGSWQELVHFSFRRGFFPFPSAPCLETHNRVVLLNIVWKYMLKGRWELGAWELGRTESPWALWYFVQIFLKNTTSWGGWHVS